MDNFVFRWFGADLDSDVRGYRYRLLAGAHCDSAGELADGWIATRDQSVLISFADASRYPDGPYVFQIVTEDEHGAVDLVPRTACFQVSVQLPPEVVFVDRPTGHLGLPLAHVQVAAVKHDREGRVVAVAAGGSPGPDGRLGADRRVVSRSPGERGVVRAPGPGD